MNERSMTPAALGAWLALTSVSGLAPATLRLLLSAFGDAQAILAQPAPILVEAAGDDIARAVAAAARADIGEQLERTQAWCEQPGNTLVSLDDPAYPHTLLTMHDPPPVLYVCGRLECLQAPGVAIVGSRSATPQGLDDAARFARELAGSGLAIVSGLALGVDAAAHWGALEADGATVAVVGTGADLVYPAKHRALAHEISLRGAIVSEWPLGTPARPSHFPQRNRLIAGLTRGVLVVEAALRSGSLITARLANEMGRDVFAIPGSIHAPLSRGCHQLIKDGAMLTETPGDVLEALGLERNALVGTVEGRNAPALGRPDRFSGAGLPRAPSKPESQLRPPSPSRAQHRRGTQRAHSPAESLPLFAPEPAQASRAPLSANAARLLDALGHAPAALEILAGRTEMDSASLQAALLELELRGHIGVLPGGRYVRHTHR